MYLYPFFLCPIIYIPLYFLQHLSLFCPIINSLFLSRPLHNSFYDVCSHSFAILYPLNSLRAPQRNSIMISEPLSLTSFCLPKHNVSLWQLLLVPCVSLWQFITYKSFISVRQGMKISWNDRDLRPRCRLNEQRVKCASLCFSVTHFCDSRSWEALNSWFLIHQIPTYSQDTGSWDDSITHLWDAFLIWL